MRWIGFLYATTILLVISSPTWAEDQGQEAPQGAAVTSGEVGKLTPAQQRAEWLKTLAAIAEEQAKPQPHQQKIATLQGKLLQLRQGTLPTGVGPGMGFMAPRPGTPVCPWGGPGLGMGMGRGPGYGQGMGYGRGPGRGGPRGPGYGPGPGMGRGGFGMGPAFVDRNQNGICDYYEYRRGW